MAKASMQAVRVHEYGGVEALVLEEAPRPEAEAGQVLVRLRAAGVNPADSAMRGGAFKQFMPLQFPWTPGLEGAGVIEAVGEGVTGFQTGQEVYGFINRSYAQYAAANEKEIQLKPVSLTMEKAASVTMGALMAWSAVVEMANVQAGQRVLIHGAAGGIGSYATQLAAWKGAHVIATTAGDNLEFVKSLGAAEAIDYDKGPFENAVKDVDAVVDTVGGDLAARSWKVMKPGGIYVTVAGRLGPEAGKAEGIRAMSAGRPPADRLAKISEMLEARKLAPTIRAVFPLAEAGKAQVLSETRHGRGRIVLRIP